jgi:hypothetical protein
MSWKGDMRLETIEAFKERKFNQYTLVLNFKKGLEMKQARNYYIMIYFIPLFNTQFYLIKPLLLRRLLRMCIAVAIIDNTCVM